jgi:cytochrome c
MWQSVTGSVVEVRMRLIATIALAGLALTGVSAQGASPDAEQVERGRQIADRVCWICHVTGTNSEFSPILRVPGPDFHAIAARPGTTAATLTAFLHTAHRTEDKPYMMPDPGLSDEMITAVVSYILSLKPHS